MAVRKGTLAVVVDGNVEYIYPKATSDMIEYTNTKNVKNKLDELDATVIEIQNTIGSSDLIEQRLDALETANGSVQGRVSTLESANTNAANRINALETTTSNMQTTINTNNSNIQESISTINNNMPVFKIENGVFSVTRNG